MKVAFYRHNEDKNLTAPVKRSSAVFYFKNSDFFKTSIHFLNYWSLKRGINDISVLLTIRDIGGHTIYRGPFKMAEKGAIEISVANLFMELDCKIISEGSIEIEFLSDQDMRISYPAVIVRYYGSDWHTTAHTSQRFLSETSGDADLSSVKLAEEGNQTIHAQLNYEPFFIIHNGRNRIEDSDFEVTVTSQDGVILTKKLENVVRGPYSTQIYYLKDLLDYRSILSGGIGTYKVKYSCSGVFPRIIAGFENNLNGRWSIDHSNFASDAEEVASDNFRAEGNDYFKNLVFDLPSVEKDLWSCFVDFYPTYPSGSYRVKVTKSEGEKIEETLVELPPQNFKKITRFTLDGFGRATFDFKSDKLLPKRFHMGIHYQYSDGEPAFLIDGPMPHSSPEIKTRWLPIFNDGTVDLALISPRFLGTKEQIGLSYECLIFNAREDEPLKYKFEVDPLKRKIVNWLEDVEGISDYLCGQPGWVYMQSDKPSAFVVHYLSRKGNSLATDHAF